MQRILGMFTQFRQDVEARLTKIENTPIQGPGHAGTIGNGPTFDPSQIPLSGSAACVGGQFQLTFSFG